MTRFDKSASAGYSNAPDIEALRMDRAARADIEVAVDAVCAELGVPGESARRRAIAEGVAGAYRGGFRQPLNLVDAGLAAAGM